MSFKNLRIATKLVSVFALMILVILGMGASSYIGQARLQKSVEATERSYDVLRAVDAVRFRLSRQENSLRGLLISGDDYYRKRIVEAHRPAYERHVTELENLIVGDPRGREQIARLKTAFKQWTDGAINPAIALAGSPETRAKAGEMVKNDGVADKLIAPVEDTADEIAADATKRLSEEAQRQADIAFWSNAVLLAGIALILGVALAAALLLRATIAAPVLAMTTAMRRLAAGDHAVDIPALGRRDEIGAMATAVGVFRDQALAKIALEGEAEQARADADRIRDMGEAERREHEATQTEVVETLAMHLSRLADGDLTCTIESDFRGRYAKLRNDFNTAVLRLEDAMSAIAAASSGVSANADAIANASDDLSRRTENQAASLEQTAAAMDEITATVRRTAAGAKETERLVAEARERANRSGEVVDQAVSAMAAIESSSRQIAQIIGVIDEIAFQTNLLALNAGVEAARAGEAGRGFAVVASEVRALAQRSAEAAKEIKALITASSEQVGTGVKSVGQAGESLRAIVAQVAEIDTLIAGIASSAVEQSTGLNEINSAVNNMDATVQQNAAMVEEATSATHALKAESAELARMVGRFRLATRAGGPALSGPPANRPGATVTVLKTSSQVAPRPDRDEWEEF